MHVIQELKQQLVQRLERRSEPRTFGDRQLIVIWEGDRHSVGSATALDWSTRGLRIRHSLPLDRHDIVTVLAPEWRAHARVVWMVESEHGKEAGLLFLDKNEITE